MMLQNMEDYNYINSSAQNILQVYQTVAGVYKFLRLV